MGSPLMDSPCLPLTTQEHHQSPSGSPPSHSDQSGEKAQQEATAATVPSSSPALCSERPCDATKLVLCSYHLDPPIFTSECQGWDDMEQPLVTLENRSMWEALNAAGNEMIVTREGRCLFPPVCVSILGLNPEARYEVLLCIVPVDKYFYTYHNSKWIPVGVSRIQQKKENLIYIHPDSLDPHRAMGEYLMRENINFKTLKISHYPNSQQHENLLLVRNMHKYVIEIVVQSRNTPSTTVRFPETTFIAVSGYQNQRVHKMKVTYNKIAAGPRDVKLPEDPVKASSSQVFIPLSISLQTSGLSLQTSSLQSFIQPQAHFSRQLFKPPDQEKQPEPELESVVESCIRPFNFQPFTFQSSYM